MKMPSPQSRLLRSFYERDPVDVARDLLGMSLLRKINGWWIGGRIVETEAYLSHDDLASHSVRGPTASNSAMFGPPGTLYVYPIHAKYCLNAVTEPTGTGSAVLIRALEPFWGITSMQRQRHTDDIARLTRGPAMLCQSLNVDRSLDHTDMVESKLISIFQAGQPEIELGTSERIGVTRSRALRLRFFIDGNWFVSGRRKDHRSPPVPPAKTLRS